MIISKEHFGLISLGFAFASLVPYIWSVHKGQTKPHVFTWVLWTLFSAIGSAGQFVSGAGPGAWASGFTAICNCVIVIQSLKHGEKNITRSDWFFFITALLSIGLWALTDNPLYAIILITIVDIFAYGPTFRKSWAKPHEENALSHFLSLPKHAATLMAIEQYVLTNTLFPLTMIIVNGALVAYLLIRRWQIRFS